MPQKDWPNFSSKLIYNVGKILNSGKINYTTGSHGKKFEKEFSNFIGNRYSIAICNGTVALEVAIKSLKLPKNSEILVPARSFFSSASCIVNTGHKPIFVDVDLVTQNICLKDIKKKITSRTKALICVHLGGLPCSMSKIKRITNKNKIKIIEDCSQAHGASINGKQVGSFGDIATWSFCNDKIISTLGEGGMISTNNKKIFEFSKRYINHGSVVRKKKNSEKFEYNKDYFGTNLRLTEIQSYSGSYQLKNLKSIQKKREKISKDYFKLISMYQNYFDVYYPSSDIKSAWYRFYFFIKKDIKFNKKLRFKIIQKFKKKKLKCFTGSCPEIYLEKAFKNFTLHKSKRLNNCKILGETSLALDVNHTLSNIQHKNNLNKMKSILNSLF